MSNATTAGGSPIPAGLKPLLMLLGVAAAVAAGVAVVLWSQGPTYSLLFGNLATDDAAQIVQSLEQAGIPYRADTQGGGISVPADRVNDARLKLAAKGLPESGGFSLIDKDPGFGVSQFMETARYQHALETELARTIGALKQVESARVHLAVPQQSAFVRDRRPSSASVFLQLKSGRRLEHEQVTSIINLVASSIPGLESNQVTVVDSQGRLLSAPERDSESAMREQQMEIARRMEEDYGQRIESLLTPFLGAGRVRAQVVAQIEMSATEEAREQYRPESQIVRSEQTSEELSRTAGGPQGIPGALTNQPPAGGTVQPLPPPGGAQAPVRAQGAGQGAAGAAAVADAGQAGAPDSTSRQSTRNYEIDRTIAYTRQPAGRLQRLSVAVVIDNLRTTDKDGKATDTPLTEEQIAKVTTLVRDAVGFDEKRGDSVTVVNQGFHIEAQADAPGEPDRMPLWEQPLVRDLAKVLAGLVIVVLLLLFIVRPLIRSLTSAPRFVAALPGAAVEAAPPAIQAQSQGAATAIAYEQQVAQARNLVQKDPARVAQVVKDWVQNEKT
jgi:flagellar M-ring protein FliF